MTLSQIRNLVRALQRRYARELAIYHLRELARDLSEEWAVAVADGQEPPQPLQVVRRVANTGKLFHTYLNLHRYIERCRMSAVSLYPVKSSWPCCPGPTTPTTPTCCIGICPPRTRHISPGNGGGKRKIPFSVPGTD